MNIRPYQSEDALAIAQLFHAAVWQLADRHYSLQQRAAWSPQIPDVAIYQEKAIDERIFLVATDAIGSVVAYGDIEADGHLDHLYCRPDVAGTGVASSLYDALEQAAIMAGITRLYVEASETALGLFNRKGFVLVTRQQITVRSVVMHNYFMIKQL